MAGRDELNVEEASALTAIMGNGVVFMYRDDGAAYCPSHAGKLDG